MTSPRLALQALSVGLALLCVTPAFAEIYKWTDENGNVVFSEKPPPDGKAEALKPRVGRASPPAAASGPAAAAEPQSDITDASHGQAPEKLTPEQIARKRQNCENAKSQLADMQSARANRLQYVNEQGERAFLTPEQREERTRKAREAIKEYCS